MRRAVAGFFAPVLLAVAGLASSAFAEAPPTAPVDSLHAPAVSRVFARSFGLGGMKTPFGATGLSDLQKVVGSGSVQHMPGSISWLCYDLPKTQQRVWLSSDETSHGLLDTVTVRAQSSGVATEACPALPAKYQPLVIDSVLRLGMSAAELTKFMGPPSRVIDTWVVYSAVQASQDGKSSLGLAVQFVNGRAVFLSVSRMNGT